MVRQIDTFGSIPLHVELSARATIPPSAVGSGGDAVAGALLAAPVAGTFSGDVEARNARGELEVEAGPLSLPGELRSVQGSSYLRTGSSWYALGSSVDPAVLPQLPLRLKDVLSKPTIAGAEKIGGTETQHVEAEVEPTRALSLLRSVTGTTIDLSRVEVKSASTDLYIDSSHHVRRFELRVDGRTTDGKAVRADVTLSMAPGTAFEVVEPTGARPLARLPQDLAGGLLGGGGATSTPALVPQAP